MGRYIERTITEIRENERHGRLYMYVVSHRSDEQGSIEIHANWDNVIDLDLELSKKLLERLPKAIEHLEKYNNEQ